MAYETFQIKSELKNSIWYNGHTFSFLVESSQTDGAFALISCLFRKGGEPPAHYHRNESETFYILEGEISFHIGDKKFTARAGEAALVPKGLPHSFKLETETAKALLLIAPSGIETLFKEFSVPAQSLELPPIPDGQPPAEFLNHMLKRATEMGIVWMPEF